MPWGPSIACSTPAAIEWVAQWKASNDPSGRLIASHNDSSAAGPAAHTEDVGHTSCKGIVNGVVTANGNGHINGVVPNGKTNGILG